MRQVRKFIVLLAVITTVFTLAHSSNLLAIESSGIGAVPANPRPDNPRSKSIFVYESPAGQTIQDAVVVINNKPQVQTLKVYPVDSQRSSDGAFACAQAADEKKEVGSWIQLAQNEVTLQPNSSQKVDFTLTIPANAEVGEHNGCIAVEESKPTQQAAGNGITLSFRSALRVALTVPGNIYANLQFSELKYSVLQDKVRVSPVVKNEGNVSVDAQVRTALQNIWGSTFNAAEGQFAVLHKDESRFNFELDRPFWGGWYKLVTSAEYTPLRDGTPGDQKKTLQAEEQLVFVPPNGLASLLYIIVPLLLLIGLFVWWRYRRHWRGLQERTIIYKAKDGDTLTSIANKAKVDWKKLAKLNNLKPPYGLEAGQSLKIPYATKQSPDQPTDKKRV